MHFSPSNTQVIMRKTLLRLRDVMLNVGMGLQKTGACLWSICELLEQDAICGALVVAPKRVANITWPDEIDQWDQFRWLRVANLREPEGRAAFMRGDHHIYLINYESLNVVCEMVAALRKQGRPPPFNLAVFDEITKAKNPSSKRIKKYRRMVGRVDRQWGLTGTMVPNNKEDLFGMYRLLDGGRRLGTRVVDFRSRFYDVNPYNPYEKNLREGADEQIARLIEDMTMTLTSKDWLDIPPPFFEDIDVPLSAALMKQYLEFEKTLVLELLNNKVVTADSMGVLSSKLLQFTAGTIYGELKTEHKIHSEKMKVLKREVASSDGPVMIVRQFQFELRELRKAFPAARFFEDAKNPAQERQLVKDWNAKKIPILVTHPASAGHGLNLQYGSHEIIWLTQTYNRDNHDQINARLARRGQTHNVRIRRLMVPDSIDYAVTAALECKREEEDALFRCLKHLAAAKGSPLALL